jgi:cytochrome bd-type quinol oxidase subunit 1
MRRVKKLIINIISVMFSSAYFTIIFFTLIIVSFAYVLEKIQEYFTNRKEKRESWKRKEVEK